MRLESPSNTKPITSPQDKDLAKNTGMLNCNNSQQTPVITFWGGKLIHPQVKHCNNKTLKMPICYHANQQVDAIIM